jgi:hypothetical protein
MTRKAQPNITSIDDAAAVRWLASMTEGARTRSLASPSPDAVARMRIRVMNGIATPKATRRIAA